MLRPLTAVGRVLPQRSLTAEVLPRLQDAQPPRLPPHPPWPCPLQAAWAWTRRRSDTQPAGWQALCRLQLPLLCWLIRQLPAQAKHNVADLLQGNCKQTLGRWHKQFYFVL